MTKSKNKNKNKLCLETEPDQDICPRGSVKKGMNTKFHDFSTNLEISCYQKLSLHMLSCPSLCCFVYTSIIYISNG